MNKKELVAAIADSMETTKINAERFLETFAEVVTGGVADGLKVTLSGFGAWESVERPEREGRNPQTGENIMIAAKVSPKFKFAKAFKERVAGV